MSVWARTVWLLAMASAVEAATWVTVSNARFEVITDAGAEAGRRLVTNLEQFDGAIAHTEGLPRVDARLARVRIYLFRSEAEFGQFRGPSTAVGLTLSTYRTAPVIVLFEDAQTRSTALHEYFHALVKRGDWKLPGWMEEGMAEFYGHAAPAGKERSGEERLALGRLIPEHVALLRERGVDASVFETKGPAFYAASWALVHLLFMEPAYRPQVEDFVQMKTSDPRFVAAVRQIPMHLARPVREETVVAPVVEAGDFTVDPVNAVDVEFMLADLLLDAGKSDAANRRYRKIAEVHRKDSIGTEALGLAALATGDSPLAISEFRKAVEAGSKRARVWSELASLERDAGAGWAAVRPLLEKAAELDPSDYRPAFRLGGRALDDGELPVALQYLKAAAVAAPDKADVWHAYALALMRAGNRGEALASARRSERVAGTAEAEAMASELVAELERGATLTSASARKKPEVVTSPAWNHPQPDAEVTGRLTEFVCTVPGSPRLRIETDGGKQVELRIGNGKQVEIVDYGVSGGTVELKCGPQDWRRVRAGYQSSDSTVLRLEYLQVHDSPRF